MHATPNAILWQLIWVDLLLLRRSCGGGARATDLTVVRSIVPFYNRSKTSNVACFRQTPG